MTTTKKPSKQAQRHLDALASGVYPQGLINGLRKTLHTLDRSRVGLFASTTSGKMTVDEAVTILHAIYDQKPRLEPSHTAKGLAYLRGARKGVLKNFGAREHDILARFDHFELVDMLDIGARYSFFVPVYAVVAANGDRFEYYTAAWQSGGSGPVIVG